MNRLPVVIGALSRVERHGLTHVQIQFHRFRSALAIHDRDWIVIRMLEICYGPRHPRGEIILKRLAPPPVRRLVRGVLLAICAYDRVPRVDPLELVSTLRPARVRLPIRLPVDVPAAPSAPIRPP